MLERIANSAYLAWQAVRQPRIPYEAIETIRRRQKRNMRAMLAHAYETVPYYRETMDRLGLGVDDFRDAEDLSRLPVIEPRQLQMDPDYFVSRAEPLESHVLLRTGGSSGDPRTVYHSNLGVLRNAGQGERERTIITKHVGRRFGYKETIIISNNSTCEKLQELSRAWSILPRRFTIKRQYLSIMDPPEVNLPLINEFGPDVIETYGSYLAMLFSYVAETGAELHRPKVVRYSSDGLPESARRLITERFGIPVFSAYQANEALKIGFECEEHSGYHLNIDLYPLRVADGEGRSVSYGEEGEVYVSNLVNTATVLLNYRLGDMAAEIPAKCACRRSLPMLSFIPGRSDDWLEMSSGAAVHPQLARTIFTTERDVWQYQVIQDSRVHFTVKVIASGKTDLDAMRSRVVKAFGERFGAEVGVDLSFVDHIDRTKAGKWRPIISMKNAQRQAGLPDMKEQ